MLPTPSTSHSCFDAIYEPAEDSFLFLDTLSSEREWLHRRFPANDVVRSATPLAVEIGTGSGVVIAFLMAHARTLVGRDLIGMGVDVNDQACSTTATTVQTALVEQNSRSVYLGSICGDLCSTLPSHSVDILLCNPPYVPTPELPVLPPHHVARGKFERDSHLLSLSYAGGQDGMEMTDRLLAVLPDVLGSRGVAYVVFCAQNKPGEVKSRIRAWPGHWQAETAGRSGKTAGWEQLEIVRIWQASPTSVFSSSVSCLHG